MSIRLRNSAKAVVFDGDRLLVTRNRSDGDPAGDWLLLPGGGQYPGETLAEAVRREVREETGYGVEPQRLLWIREYIGGHHEFALYAADEHQLEFMFECRIVSRGEQLEADQHQVGVEWARVADLSRLRFYPAALIGPLMRFETTGRIGPVYLGDVN